MNVSDLKTVCGHSSHKLSLRNDFLVIVNMNCTEDALETIKKKTVVVSITVVSTRGSWCDRQLNVGEQPCRAASASWHSQTSLNRSETASDWLSFLSAPSFAQNDEYLGASYLQTVTSFLP